MRRTPLLATMLVVVPLTGITGQQTLSAGDRIRVSIRGVSAPLVGTVISLASDAVVLSPENRSESVAVPFASVSQLDVSRGRSPRWFDLLGYGVTGGFIGAIAGATVIPLLTSSDCLEPAKTPDNTTTCAIDVADFRHRARTAARFGAVGVAVGVLLGALLAGERWDELPMGRVRLGLARRRRAGLGLKVAIGF